MSFTTDLEDFLDNQNPGGYVQTSVNIETSDLTNRIDEIITSKGYLKSETDPTVPAWAKQPVKPTYTASEVGAIPTNGISISNTLNSGTRLATITINGVSTNIYGNNSSGGSGGGDVTVTNYYNGLRIATINDVDICMPSTFTPENYATLNDISSLREDILGVVNISNLKITDSNNNVIEDYSNLFGIKNIITSSCQTFNPIDYGYSNFGTTNFYVQYQNENKHLVEDIFNALNIGKTKIIFIYNEDIWIANNFIDDDNYKGIIFNNLTSNIIKNEIGENDNEILENLEIYTNDLVILENQTTKVTYFKFFKNIPYLNANFFKRLFDYGQDLEASQPVFYPIATDINMYDEDGYATWSRVVTTDYLEHRLSQL